MSKTTKRYTKEFKEKAVKKVLLEGRTIKAVNEEFSLGQGSLQNWIKEYKEKQPQEQMETNEKLREAYRKIAELEKQNEFLKKASAFFASESGKDSNT